MKLSEYLKLANVEIPLNFIDCEIENIETDSRTALKNKNKMQLFVCIKGSNHNTHNDIATLISYGISNFVAEYIPENVEIPIGVNVIITANPRKLLAKFAQIYYGFPDGRLTKIAITGTKGKTTVTYMLAKILECAGKKCGIIGTNGIIYDGNRIETSNSTPGSLQFYKSVFEMANCGVEYLICEVTSQGLKHYRTYGTIFDFAIFTNLFSDHICAGEHKDYDEYRAWKGTLFESCKKAIINIDDKESEYFKDICQKNSVPYFTVSANGKSANYKCRIEETGVYGTKFEVNGKKYKITIPGEFNVLNALCAVAGATLNEITYENISMGLLKTTVLGRCERVENDYGINVIIDYAHNKESLENILKTLKKECCGKIIVVFGAGGDRSKLRRYGMGKAAAEFSDFSVITSDNPRTENLNEIISDILRGMDGGKSNYIVVPQRKEAIFYALSVAEKGDTVLLAGKGAQMYEEINGIKYRFDEREIVSDYFNSKVKER